MTNLLEQQGTRRLRMDSCLRLIQDVSHRLNLEGAHPNIVAQLERLDELLSLIDQSSVTEHDLARIEGSCNQLMQEIQVLFDHQDLGSLYDEPVH